MAGRLNNALAATAALALLAGCAAGGAGPRNAPPSREAAELDAVEQALRARIDVLASDAFGGRRPGTEGEQQTLRYLVREWQGFGLESGTNEPANPWFAPVDLTLSVPASSRVTLLSGGRAVTLAADEGRAFTVGPRALLAAAPVLYVGPARADAVGPAAIAGRVVVMDWGGEDDPTRRDAYYAAGAAAVLGLVRDARALTTLADLRHRGTYALAGQEGDLVDGFITQGGLARVMGDPALSQRMRDARRAGFAGGRLPLQITIEANSTPGTVRTHNLIGKLPGRRPDAGAVLVMAHWDHFGTCAPGAENPLCRGAVDNASGVAAMSEIARRLAAGPRPDRDVYFLATTAEEWGLLGAHAFVRNPALPLGTIVAALNLDTIAVAPRGSAVAIIGARMTGLDGAIAAAAARQGRALGDNDYASRYLRRQDGWVLLGRDVPAVVVTSAFADEARFARFVEQRYHQASDVPQGIELGGAAQDTLLNLDLVRLFADPARWPASASPSAQ